MGPKAEIFLNRHFGHYDITKHHYEGLDKTHYELVESAY